MYLMRLHYVLLVICCQQDGDHSKEALIRLRHRVLEEK